MRNLEVAKTAVLIETLGMAQTAEAGIPADAALRFACGQLVHGFSSPGIVSAEAPGFSRALCAGRVWSHYMRCRRHLEKYF